jgi:arsenate reductase (thioredoxin)
VSQNQPSSSSIRRVLFVCVENSNRSQMAQAFAKILGGASVEAHSAGSRPSGVVNPRAIAAMKELGYDLSGHASKSLQEVPHDGYDFVATMGCGDACPMIHAKRVEDWAIPDPRHMSPEEFRGVRDLIRDKVGRMLAELGIVKV